MTNDELFRKFKQEFECDCYEPICDVRDCTKCGIFIECFEEWKEMLGYAPSIMVGL